MGRGTIALTLLFTLGAGDRPVRAVTAVPRRRRGQATIGPGQFLLEHLIEGLIRVFIFVGYLLVISRSARSAACSSTTAPST